MIPFAIIAGATILGLFISGGMREIARSIRALQAQQPKGQP